MSIAPTLAWRYLWGRKLRTLLTTLAVVFGVAVIFGLNSMLPTMMETFSRLMMSSAGQVDLTVTSASGSTFEAKVVDKVRHVSGISAVSPSLRRLVTMPKGAAVPRMTVVGIEPMSAARVRNYPVAAGRMLGASDRGAVVVGVELADKARLHPGAHLRLPTVAGTRTYKVVGTLDVASAPGVEEVYMTLADAQALFAEGSRVSEIDAAFGNGADRAVIEQRVRRAVGSDYVVGGIQEQGTLLASIKVGQFMMNMFGVFALAMGGFIILNTFRTVVAERRHDIGMLRAVGARRSTILNIFLAESVFQGVLGTVVGLAGGWALGWGVVSAINPMYISLFNQGIPGPGFSLSALILAVTLGMGVTIAGALSPALAAARITPLDALRPQIGEVEERQRSRKAWVGLAVLVASGVMLVSGDTTAVGAASVAVLVGLVLVAPQLVAPVSNAFAWAVDLIFRTEGEIARSNMQRQPSRAATTAAAVMISLSIIIALMGVLTSVFSGFIDYLDKSIAGADYAMIPSQLILGAGNVGISDDLVTAVREHPGVGAVATLRIARAQIEDTQVQVIGIDPVDYPKVASLEFAQDGRDEDIQRLDQGRGLIANGIYAAQNGVRVGQKLDVRTANGVKSYEVVAIASDYLNAKLSTVYVSQERLREDFGTEANVALLANASPGADKVGVLRSLRRVVADYPQLTLYDTTEFRDLQLRTFGQAMGMYYILLAILAIPSLLALLNNLAMSVIARTREIGMLRAVGSTRGQVQRMVVAESVLLASVGVVFGVLSGVVLGYSLVAATNAVGFEVPYFFPTGGILAAVVIGYVFALLAAIIPARTAARLDIVRALHYE